MSRDDYYYGFRFGTPEDWINNHPIYSSLYYAWGHRYIHHSHLYIFDAYTDRLWWAMPITDEYCWPILTHMQLNYPSDTAPLDADHDTPSRMIFNLLYALSYTAKFDEAVVWLRNRIINDARNQGACDVERNTETATQTDATGA